MGQILKTESAAARVDWRAWIAFSSRSISERKSAMRSESSGADKSSMFCPIS